MQDWAVHYISRAISLYNEWGAFAKVRQMNDDHEWMISCTHHENFSANNSASSTSPTETLATLNVYQNDRQCRKHVGLEHSQHKLYTEITEYFGQQSSKTNVRNANKDWNLAE